MKTIKKTLGGNAVIANNSAKGKTPPPASKQDLPVHIAQNATAPEHDLPETRPIEHGGQAGLEPTRYGDWEKKGRCTDF